MLAELSSVQASEWMAFLGIHVPDEILGAALVSSTIANVMGDGNRAYVPADFLPAAPNEDDVDPDLVKLLLVGCVPGED